MNVTIRTLFFFIFLIIIFIKKFLGFFFFWVRTKLVRRFILYDLASYSLVIIVLMKKAFYRNIESNWNSTLKFEDISPFKRSNSRKKNRPHILTWKKQFPDVLRLIKCSLTNRTPFKRLIYEFVYFWVHKFK